MRHLPGSGCLHQTKRCANKILECPAVGKRAAAPSVHWRRKHLPNVTPRLQLHSILAVMEAVAAGLAIGVVPLFLARAYSNIVALTEPLAEFETDLWLLAHPESRHLRRIAVVAATLAERVQLK